MSKASREAAQKMRRMAGYALLENEAQRRGECHDCGEPYDGNPRHFHWHHFNPPDKKFTIRHRAHYPTASLLAELEKCWLICVGCHLARHGNIPRKDPVA